MTLQIRRSGSDVAHGARSGSQTSVGESHAGPSPPSQHRTNTIQRPPAVDGPVNAFDSLASALDIDGCMGVALGDHTSGLTLGAVGTIEREALDAAVAAATKTLKSTFAVIERLERSSTVDDLIIDIGDRIHIACPVPVEANGPGLFLYAIFDARVTGLGLARKHLRTIADAVTV